MHIFHYFQWEGGHLSPVGRGRHGDDAQTGLEVRVHVRAVHLPPVQGPRLNLTESRTTTDKYRYIVSAKPVKMLPDVTTVIFMLLISVFRASKRHVIDRTWRDNVIYNISLYESFDSFDSSFDRCQLKKNSHRECYKYVK